MPFDLERVSTVLRELKRRRVYSVAVGYLAVAWVGIDVSETVLPALGAPEWSITIVVIAAIGGFPLAIALGWIYDLTPQGIRRTADARDREVTPAASVPSLAPGDLHSIVVLPFIDGSPNGEHQYLGDGITEELINGLARIEGLRVVSRTSAFALRGQADDVRELGARLGVGSVVEGSLRVHEDRLRLTVQFVAAQDGLALWSHSFDRLIDDVFGVQEDVARAIVQVVGREFADTDDTTTVSLPPIGEVLPASTRNVEAYQLYLRGLHHRSKRTGKSMARANEYFERALEFDPDYAQAHAAVAENYALLMDYGLLSPAEGLPRARQAIGEALRLGPELAESHASAAIVRQIEWSWQDAEHHSLTAIKLNRGYASARHRWALLLAWLGRFEESREEIEVARDLDPLAPAITSSVGWVAYYARDYAGAIRVLRETLEDHPSFATARIALGLALLQHEAAADAVTELGRAHEQSGEAVSVLSLLAYAQACAGDVEAARTKLDRITELSNGTYVSRYYRALPLVGMGEHGAALEELRAAATERTPQLVYMGVEPLFDPLRGTPEFDEILAMVGLP